jgi:putative ABC transport system permease protein
MRKLRALLFRLVAVFNRKGTDRDFTAELESHLQLHIDDNLRAGTSPAEARRQALIKLGGLEQTKESLRDRRRFPKLDSFCQDIRFSLRMLRKSPAFTTIAVLTLALGIGATTTIFSVVYGVLLRPLPFSQPNRVVAIWEINSKGDRAHLADPNFDDFRVQNHTLQSIAKYTAYEDSISDGAEATRATVAAVSPEFMQVLRATPFIGRDFLKGDDSEGAAPACIVSYGFWKDFLGSPSDLGRNYLKIENAQYVVVGVMPVTFRFPQNAMVWIPADLHGENKSRTAHNYLGIGRLRDGLSTELARQDISAIARRIHATSTEKNDYLLMDATALPLQESLTGSARKPLLILLGAALFLLLVACANVTSLMLAQASVRGRELAIRSALGAGRMRLIRQFLTEAMVLTLVGGACGVLGALSGVTELSMLAPQSLVRDQKISVSLPVLAFALALSTLVAAALSTFTTLRATGGDLRKGLSEGGRGEAGTRGRRRTSGTIVSVQVAITLVLVVGAGLLGRSLMKALEVDPGFRVDGIIGMDISLPWTQDPKVKTEQGIFYSDLIRRLEQIPGVQNVGAISNLPSDGGLPDGMFVLMTPGEAPKDINGFSSFWQDKSRTREADFGVASPGYFQTMGIPLVRGRLFDQSDGPNTAHVALVSQSLARQVWPHQDAIGHTIEFGNMDGDMRLLTIIGVVKDVHDYGPDAPTQPTVYVDLFQRPRATMTITMRSGADVRSVTSAARNIVQELNPQVAPEFRTLRQVYSASLASREFNAILLGSFGVTALLLALVGVYGVISYGVSERTREIGVRMALGAARSDVLRMLMREGMLVVFAGTLVGVGGALVLTRLLKSLLFEIKPTDPATFGSVVVMFMLVTMAACYIPARRAMRVDCMVALRHE